MNLMMLINSWLDINCQITTKCATVAKPKLFHQLNTPLVCHQDPLYGIHYIYPNVDLNNLLDACAFVHFVRVRGHIHWSSDDAKGRIFTYSLKKMHVSSWI